MAADMQSLGKSLVDGIKAYGGMAVGIGLLLIVTGLLAIAAPFVAGVSVMLMLGALLLVGGIAVSLLAFRIGAFGAGLGVLLIGLLMAVVGVYFLAEPVAALGSMTLFLAIYFFVTGLTEAVAAFGARPAEGWGWMAASGVVSVLLGVMLWRQYPLSGIWAVGTLFGIKLLTSGFWLFSIGSTVRRGAGGLQASR
ncbi:MAG TPA: DUF308 domain-containing protein [Vicinamibacterales bacterium]|nr:DUF308 domain-containing protein [Vicinamibacterales bacterium]